MPELRERVNIPFSLYVNALQEIYSNKYQVRFLEKKREVKEEEQNLPKKKSKLKTHTTFCLF